MGSVEHMCHSQWLPAFSLLAASAGKAMLIFDNVNPTEDARVALGINNFLYKSSLGRQFDRILEMPLFVNSSITPAIQIADFFAGIVRHYNNSILDHSKTLTDSFEMWIDGLYQKVFSKTENLVQRDAGFTEYGFYDSAFLNPYIHNLPNRRSIGRERKARFRINNIAADLEKRNV